VVQLRFWVDPKKIKILSFDSGLEIVLFVESISCLVIWVLLSRDPRFKDFLKGLVWSVMSCPHRQYLKTFYLHYPEILPLQLLNEQRSQKATWVIAQQEEDRF
jgi:hypothetical protein